MSYFTFICGTWRCITLKVNKYCLNTTKSLLLDAETGLRPVSSNVLHAECAVHPIPVHEFWERSQLKFPGAPAPGYFTIKSWHMKTHFPTQYILIAWLRTTDINYLFLTTKGSIWKSQMSIETDSTGHTKKESPQKAGPDSDGQAQCGPFQTLGWVLHTSPAQGNWAPRLSLKCSGKSTRLRAQRTGFNQGSVTIWRGSTGWKAVERKTLDLDRLDSSPSFLT